MVTKESFDLVLFEENSFVQFGQYQSNHAYGMLLTSYEGEPMATLTTNLEAQHSHIYDSEKVFAIREELVKKILQENKTCFLTDLTVCKHIKTVFAGYNVAYNVFELTDEANAYIKAELELEDAGA